MKHQPFSVWFVGLCLILGSAICQADHWPNWRSEGQNGVAPEGTYPTSWSATDQVRWKAKLPGAGGSTPIVAQDRILVTCPDDGENAVICFDLKGTEQWKTMLGKERPGKHRKGTGSNPSPVTDGELIFVYFKSGDLACLDFSGEIVWRKNLQQEYGEDTLWWDLGTSPVLTRENVVVACMQTGNSYLVALDKETGEQTWKQDRNLDAPEEANQSYTTPLVVQRPESEVIVTLGADHVTANDATTGKELWRVGGLNPKQNGFFRSISSPVVTDDIVIAPYARGNSLTAIRMGGSGDVTGSHVIWSKGAEFSADVPTPAAVDGRVYVCTDKGELSCLNAESGDVLWKFSLPRSRVAYSASPILANGYLYATREDGTTFVVREGQNAEVVGENELDESIVATPVFVDDSILIRTAEHLYCIGAHSP